jgi:5-methylcytosine-specific restriction protein A
MKHIEYYEEKHNTHRKIEREIHDEFVEIAKEAKEGLFETSSLTDDGISEYRIIRIRKRSRAARRECIKEYKAVCYVCGFDFEKFYGEMGKGYIHVHHIVPLSTRKQIEEMTADDLRPVCPNCHAMLHKGKNPPTIEELKKLIKH